MAWRCPTSPFYVPSFSCGGDKASHLLSDFCCTDRQTGNLYIHSMGRGLRTVTPWTTVCVGKAFCLTAMHCWCCESEGRVGVTKIPWHENAQYVAVCSLPVMIWERTLRKQISCFWTSVKKGPKYWLNGVYSLVHWTLCLRIKEPHSGLSRLCMHLCFWGTLPGHKPPQSPAFLNGENFGHIHISFQLPPKNSPS